MSKDLVNPPNARSWRDIPQPVQPRVMSAGGRWRLVGAMMRNGAVAAVLGVVVWGAWQVVGVFQKNPRQMPAVAKAVPLRELVLQTDGVLEKTWLARALALPPKVSLAELDLLKLKARLLTHGQVKTATLSCAFPSTLEVRIFERSPIARLKAEWRGRQQQLFVARDGVVFEGEGFDPTMMERLPWLDGIKLIRGGAGFQPLKGMATVADLLSKAQLEAEHLYRSWQVVSLARLETDGELEVRTKSGTTIVFNAKGSFFRQLARLDYMLELAAVPATESRINLSLGADVPVAFRPPSENAVTERPIPPFPTSGVPFLFSPSPPSFKREL